MCSTSVTSKFDHVVRANAYHSLAAAFRQPGEWRGGEPQALEQHFKEFGGELAELSEKVAFAWNQAISEPQNIEIAFAKLFLGPFEILAPPYAAIYLDTERRLMGPVSLYAATAYAAAGLDQVGEVREIPDHIIIELEFMYFLSFSASSSEDVDFEIQQGKFWSEHLGKWLPPFAKSIAVAKVHPFYDALAQLLSKFIEYESSLHESVTSE